MFVLYSHRIAAVHKIIQFFWCKKGDSVRDKITCFRLRLLSDGTHIEIGKFARATIGQSTCEISSLIAQVISLRHQRKTFNSRLHKLFSEIEPI